jgi:hypothetical protein
VLAYTANSPEKLRDEAAPNPAINRERLVKAETACVFRLSYPQSGNFSK